MAPSVALTPLIESLFNDPPPVGIGERASNGELAAVVTRFSCADAAGKAGTTPIQGQLCTAHVVVENHGNLAVRAEPYADLRVAGGDEVYPVIEHTGRAYSLIIFPDDAARPTSARFIRRLPGARGPPLTRTDLYFLVSVHPTRAQISRTAEVALSGSSGGLTHHNHSPSAAVTRRFRVSGISAIETGVELSA